MGTIQRSHNQSVSIPPPSSARITRIVLSLSLHSRVELKLELFFCFFLFNAASRPEGTAYNRSRRKTLRPNAKKNATKDNFFPDSKKKGTLLIFKVTFSASHVSLFKTKLTATERGKTQPDLTTVTLACWYRFGWYYFRNSQPSSQSATAVEQSESRATQKAPNLTLIKF